MSAIAFRHLAARSLLAGAVAMAAGCGGESEQELTTAAKASLQQNKPDTAIVQMKAALQKNPQSGELRFLLGDTLMKTGNAKAAVVEFGKAADLKYDDNRVLPALVMAMIATGQSKQAVQLYGGATLSDPKAAAELSVALATAHVALDEREAAALAVQRSLALDPSNESAQLMDARFMAGQGKAAKALERVQPLTQQGSKRREALQLAGEIQWKALDDLDAAAKNFRAVITLDPRYVPAHTSLLAIDLRHQDKEAFGRDLKAMKNALPNNPETRFYETQQALIDHDIKRARELVQQLLKAGPNSVRILQLAGAIESVGGSTIVAETYLTKALQLSPDLPFARRLLAEVLIRSGQPSRALTTLKPLLDQPSASADVLALAAEALLMNGEAGQAEQLFVRASRADPSNLKLQANLALTEIARGRTDAGFAQLESVAQRDRSAYADLALIGARLRRQDGKGALVAIERLQAKDPDKPLASQLKGQVLLQQGDRTGARQAYERAITLDPQYLPALSGLASMDIADKKPEVAAKRYEDLLRQDPKNSRALAALAEIKRAAGAPPEEVSKKLQEAIRLNPLDPTPRVMLVEHHLAQRDGKAAMAAAQDAVAASPDDPQALIALGRAQVFGNEIQQAISTFGKLVAARPEDARFQMMLADAYEVGKDYSGAERALLKALETSPDLLAAQSRLVQVRVAQKRYAEALQVARTVQKQRTKDGAGQILESNVNVASGNLPAAISAMRAALDRQSTTDTAMRLHGLYLIAKRSDDADRFATEWMRGHPRDIAFLAHLGNAELGQGQWAKAEAHYRALVAIRPDDAPAHNNIAWLLLQQNKPGALASAQRAVELAPDRPESMDTLSNVWAAEGKMDKALEWERKAADAPNASPGYRLNLAKLLIKSGDRSAARAELEKLAKLGDKFSNQKEVADLMKSL